MEEYFSQEVKNLKRELTNLKTIAQKSAAVIQTAAQTVNVSMTLKLNDVGSTASGGAYYIVKPENEAIITCTLTKYCDDPSQRVNFPATIRYFDVLQNKLNDTDYIIYVFGHGDASDRATLSGGGSVILTNALTIMATAPFTVEAI